MRFKDIDTAYRTIIEQAVGTGDSVYGIAKRTGQIPQQIYNAKRTGKVKYSSLKRIADDLGYDVKIVLTLKKEVNGLQRIEKITQ